MRLQLNLIKSKTTPLPNKSKFYFLNLDFSNIHKFFMFYSPYLKSVHSELWLRSDLDSCELFRRKLFSLTHWLLSSLSKFIRIQFRVFHNYLQGCSDVIFPGQPTLKKHPPTPTHLLLSMWIWNAPKEWRAFEKKYLICKNCNMISHIILKSKAKMISLQNPGQPMGWPGWPVATALILYFKKINHYK